MHLRRCRHERIERQQRVQRGELGHPRVAELRHVRRRLAHVGREQLFVRSGPGNLLHAHAHTGILALERRDQLRHDLAFAPQSPEVENSAAGGWVTA